MPRRGSRVRLRAGIYKDAIGIAAVVCVGKRQKERRFPFGHPLDLVEQWQRDERRLLELDTPKHPRGSLGADIKRYENAIRDLSGFVQRRAEIRAWERALGADRLRGRISQEDVRQVRGDWLASDVAPKTINNRVWALQHLYRTLDGHHIRTPCDDFRPLTVPKRPAVRVPDALIRTIFDNMLEAERRGVLRDGKTRARFAVYASTGHRPSEIGRAQPLDVDLERRIWTPRDAKGGFCPGVYLNVDMLEAWKLFYAADAWGSFDSGSLASRIHAYGLPAHVPPYHLRHTVGILASESGADLRDVADHLGHKRTETTRRHYVPVLQSRLQRLSEALDSRALGWRADAPSPRVPGVPGSVPGLPVASRRETSRSVAKRRDRKPRPKTGPALS
jgi:site-specific recombinase XerD